VYYENMVPMVAYKRCREPSTNVCSSVLAQPTKEDASFCPYHHVQLMLKLI
jgi:hypothetical protein